MKECRFCRESFPDSEVKKIFFHEEDRFRNVCNTPCEPVTNPKKEAYRGDTLWMEQQRYLKNNSEYTTPSTEYEYPDKKIITSYGFETDPSIDPILEDALADFREKTNTSEEKRLLKAAYKHIDGLESELKYITTAADKFQQVPVRKARKIKLKNDLDTVDFYTILSDVHPGKRVTSDQTLGLNEYNPEIAQARLDSYWVQVGEYINLHSTRAYIRDVNLVLGGDMIENRYMHSGEATDATMGAAEEIAFMVENIHAGIEYIKKQSIDKDLAEAINVICIVGNHDRMPNHRRVPCSNRTAESLATILYTTLATYYKDDDDINFIIPNGEGHIHDSFGFRTMFVHGDGFNSAGTGVQGLVNSVKRFYAKKKATHNIDFMAMGHWHHYLFNPEFIVNGSVCSYDAYSFNKSFGYQPAQQATWVVSGTHKLVQFATQIFL